jgi:hypothetical protein
MRTALAIAGLVMILLLVLLVAAGNAYGAPKVDPRCQCVPQLGTHAAAGPAPRARFAGHYGRHGR